MKEFLLELFLLADEQSLFSIIQKLIRDAQKVLEGLIFLSFLVGLGLYVLPPIPPEIQAKGKSMMERACIAQVLLAMATMIFNWILKAFG